MPRFQVCPAWKTARHQIVVDYGNAAIAPLPHAQGGVVAYLFEPVAEGDQRRVVVVPSQDKLQVLAEWLNVEPQILRFGEKTVLSIQSARKHWGEAIGYQEREVFEAFLALPSPQRKVLREVILTFAKANALPVPGSER